MRTLKIIHHGSVERINTISAHCICNLSIQKSIYNSEASYIDIFWGVGTSMSVQLPTGKAYALYHDITDWFSDGCDNLVVELRAGLSGDSIDYIATRD